MADANLLGNLRETAARSQVVGSVCTGSLLLAAAGLLEGHQATTHWMYRDLLTRWAADSGQYALFARQLLEDALAGHPALLAHLSN